MKASSVVALGLLWVAGCGVPEAANGQNSENLIHWSPGPPNPIADRWNGTWQIASCVDSGAPPGYSACENAPLRNGAPGGPATSGTVALHLTTPHFPWAKLEVLSGHGGVVEGLSHLGIAYMGNDPTPTCDTSTTDPFAAPEVDFVNHVGHTECYRIDGDTLSAITSDWVLAPDTSKGYFISRVALQLVGQGMSVRWTNKQGYSFHGADVVERDETGDLEFSKRL